MTYRTADCFRYGLLSICLDDYWYGTTTTLSVARYTRDGAVVHGCTAGLVSWRVIV